MAPVLAASLETKEAFPVFPMTLYRVSCSQWQTAGNFVQFILKNSVKILKWTFNISNRKRSTENSFRNYDLEFLFKNTWNMRLEMGQWVKALAAFLDTWVQSPAPTQLLTTISNFSSRGYNVLFWPPRATGTYVVHRYTWRQNTHTKILEYILLTSYSEL